MKPRAVYIQKRPDSVSWLFALSNVFIVFAPVFVAAYLGTWLAIALALLWFGTLGATLGNMLHESAHRLLFRSSRWNDRIGRYFLAPAFVTVFEKYRGRHFAHHHHVGTVHDTKYIYLTRLRGLGFVIFVARCLTGMEALSRITAMRQESKFVKRLTSSERWRGLIAILVFQGLFVAGLFVAALTGTRNLLQAIQNALIVYVIVYGYGVLAGVTLWASLRGISEHCVQDGDERHGNASLRNLRPTLATRILFGSYGFCEHGTHHEHPAIPHYRLPELTRDLAAERPGLAYRLTYWSVLRNAIF